ncbi:fimbrial biogenesis outer membrane usher protein, partial [Acinetobacter baumannii]
QSVRLGGIQLRHNFSIRPDLITYPLPQFTGQAALPSTVDLFINGLKNSTNDIQPGPYILNNVPFINGRGEAVVVTTDAVGRQVSTTLPFYV